MGPSRIAVAIAVVLAISAAAYVFWPWRAELPPPPVAAPAPPAPPKGPLHPVASGASQPLPALAESDAPLAEAIAGLVGMEALGRFVQPEALVRNFVATIDALPRETVAQRVNPLKAVPGLPVTSGREKTLQLAPANAARYAPAVRMVEALDAARVSAIYRRFYPLFQQAYEELGYPGRYFNDRLVEVIDHLLEAPEPAGPILLVQPKVLYEFADPELEALSAGQKAMLRVGAENERRLKAKLRELRRELTSG